MALGAFLAIKTAADPMIVLIGIAAIVAILAFEKFYLRDLRGENGVGVANTHHRH